MTPGIGAGRLSDAAKARRGQAATPPLRPPPPDDLVAVEAWRQSIHGAWLECDPPPADCGHVEGEFGKVRCLVAESATAKETSSIIVYLHGGGYALGSPEVAIPITERLGVGHTVISVDYRLAPEHPHPAAVHDALAVLDAVANAEPARAIVLAGDSAGANIAVSAALSRKKAHDRPLDGLVLLSPHLDHGRRDPADLADPTVNDPTSDVDAVAAAWLRAAYCGERVPEDPLVSPLRADLGALPKTLVQVGTDDSSFGHGVRFSRLARVAGIDVTLDVWQGMWHTWHYHRDLPEADLALAEANRFSAACGR